MNVYEHPLDAGSTERKKLLHPPSRKSGDELRKEGFRAQPSARALVTD